MKLLIGYDRSPACEKAIADLADAGLPESGEAVVVSVQDFYAPPPMPAEMLPGSELMSPYYGDLEATKGSLQTDLQTRADEGAAKVRAVLPGWTVSGQGLIEPPTWGLITAAEKMAPDLVVVGAPHGSRLEQVFFGSVCANVAAKCPVSVRVGRGRTTPRTHPLRILAAVDGSAFSDAAIAALAARNWPANAEIRLLHVVESDWPAFTPESEKIFEEVGRRMLERYARSLNGDRVIQASQFIALERSNPIRNLIERNAFLLSRYPHPSLAPATVTFDRHGVRVAFTKSPGAETLLNSIRKNGARSLHSVIECLAQIASAIDHAANLDLGGVETSPESVALQQSTDGTIRPVLQVNLLSKVDESHKPAWTSSFACLAYWMLGARGPKESAFVTPAGYCCIPNLGQAANETMRAGLCGMFSGRCVDLLSEMARAEGVDFSCAEAAVSKTPFYLNAPLDIRSQGDAQFGSDSLDNRTVEQAIRYGKPRKVVLEEAAAWDADVLFVGAKGMSGVERLLLGSVSSAVASRATCTVEIVRS